MIILVDVTSKIHCLSNNIKSHSFIISLCYLGSKSMDSLLSVASCFFHKFLVVAFTDTTVKIDGVTKTFYVKNKFGNTMELGHGPFLTLFVAAFVPSREACMEEFYGFSKTVSRVHFILQIILVEPLLHCYV